MTQLWLVPWRGPLQKSEKQSSNYRTGGRTVLNGYGLRGAEYALLPSTGWFGTSPDRTKHLNIQNYSYVEMRLPKGVSGFRPDFTPELLKPLVLGLQNKISQMTSHRCIKFATRMALKQGKSNAEGFQLDSASVGLLVGDLNNLSVLQRLRRC